MASVIETSLAIVKIVELQKAEVSAFLGMICYDYNLERAKRQDWHVKEKPTA